MLKSCSYCNSYHQRNETCPRKPSRKKEPTKASKFRDTWKWRKKSQAIRKLDLYLCLACKEQGIYTFDNLEVHHIVPIAEKWELRLEDKNLITLCSTCHSLAERGQISRDKCYQLIKTRNEVGNRV